MRSRVLNIVKLDFTQDNIRRLKWRETIVQRGQERSFGQGSRCARAWPGTNHTFSGMA